MSTGEQGEWVSMMSIVSKVSTTKLGNGIKSRLDGDQKKNADFGSRRKSLFTGRRNRGQ